MDARSFCDSPPQPVQAANVVIGKLHELRAKIGGFYGAQRFKRRTEGGDRVFQFMGHVGGECFRGVDPMAQSVAHVGERAGERSEEHTYELQSRMRISYAVFCLKKNNNHNHMYHNHQTDYITTR